MSPPYDDLEISPKLLTSLLAVSEAEPGQARLATAVRELAALLEMKCAFVGIFDVGDTERVHTLALWLDGALQTNITYPLKGTPCELVYNHSICFHGSGVQGKFPEDTMLVDIRAESYIATPFCSKEGERIGHLGVMDDKPMEAGLHEHAVMRLFSSLISSELLAQNSEAHRREAERKLFEGHRLESLGVLAGGIAHDFNNLLSGILGNTSLALLDAPANSSMRHYLEQIEVTSHRAAELAQQMLAYSGKGRFVVVDTNLSELVEEMTKLLMVSIASGVEVRYDLARDLPSVHADVTQMRQLIMNLVLNAADAIGEDSGVISISTGVVQVNAGDLADASLGQDQPAGEYAFIEVTDSGCGMTPDTLARVFDPFFSGKPNGRGLGLAAVQGIVAGHSGALQVRTQPGHGTTFKLLLPAVPRPATSRQDAAPPKRSPMAGSLVLVADDNDTVRTTIGRMLERLGCRTLLAEDGKACVDLFREHMSEIDVVLLDMTMPKLGGKEAFGQIRRIKPTAKVILMSGYHEHDATSHFAGKGLGGFLQKPFRIQDLVEYLNAPTP